MCVEADSFLGQIIDALDNTGARDNTYILMISDHGEDNTEHRSEIGLTHFLDILAMSAAAAAHHTRRAALILGEHCPAALLSTRCTLTRCAEQAVRKEQHV